MADLKQRPSFISSVRTPRPSMKYNFYLPRLTNSEIAQKNNNGKNSAVKLPYLSKNVENNAAATTYKNSKIKNLRRRSTKNVEKNKEALKTASKEKAPETVFQEEASKTAAKEDKKLGLGVALRISNLLSKIRRRTPTPDLLKNQSEIHNLGK